MSPWKPSLFNVGQISVFKIKRGGRWKVEKYVIVVKTIKPKKLIMTVQKMQRL